MFLFGRIQIFIGLIIVFLFENLKRLFKGSNLMNLKNFKKTFKNDAFNSFANDTALSFVGFIVVLIIAFLIAW
jgi:ABC-type spermidine/putrescine transport system permease subunit I